MSSRIRVHRWGRALTVIGAPFGIASFHSALLGRSDDGVLKVASANRTSRKRFGEASNLFDAYAALDIACNCDERLLFGYGDAYGRDDLPGVSHLATEA